MGLIADLGSVLLLRLRYHELQRRYDQGVLEEVTFTAAAAEIQAAVAALRESHWMLALAISTLAAWDGLEPYVRCAAILGAVAALWLAVRDLSG